MKMTIEVDDDFVEEIVQKALVQDYFSLTRDLKNPELMHEDDVAAFTETVKHIEGLCNWYFSPSEFKRLIKKAKETK
jgi:hypothetical protein